MIDCILSKRLTRKPLTVFGMLLLLGCSVQESLAMEHDDVEFESRRTTRPTHSPDEGGSDDETDWLADFNAYRTIQSVTRRSLSSDTLEIVVEDTDGQITTLQGMLVKDLAGTGLKQGVALKNRHGHLKPEGDTRIEYLEPLVQWYRDSITCPTFAVQLDYEKAGQRHHITLDEFQEVNPISQSEARNNTIVKILCEKNDPYRSVGILIELTCPLRNSSFREMLMQIPYEKLSGSVPLVTGYSLLPGINAQSLVIVQKRMMQTRYQFPVLPTQVDSVPVERLRATECDLPNAEEIPLVDVKSSLLKSISGSVRKQTQAIFGDYNYNGQDVVQSPYLYVENAGNGKPEFFLTRTQEVRLQKANKAELGQENMTLLFTQKVGVAVEAECVHHSIPLRTGLFKQRDGGQWCPLSKERPYEVLHTPVYQFKIFKVKTLGPMPRLELLETLKQASDVFYSKFMTLELGHPLIADGPDLNSHPILNKHFYKLICKTYPSFSLPRNLRILEIGGEDQPRLMVTLEHVAHLRSFPLNRLTLINAEMDPKAMDSAMEDYSGGYLSESRIELTTGHCLEVFENSPSDHDIKKALEAKRKQQLDQEYREHCRAYRSP